MVKRKQRDGCNKVKFSHSTINNELASLHEFGDCETPVLPKRLKHACMPTVKS